MPNLIIPELNGTLAVVCHDAGAANHIISWLRTSKDIDFKAAVFGPAAFIWQHAFPERPYFRTIEQALAGSKALLSGTGWATCIEHNSRKLAQQQGIKSIAVLDHWINYRDRFHFENEMILPDEYWVSDQFAYELATVEFPGSSIALKPNIYLDSLVREIALTADSGSEILYVLEPTRNFWGGNKPGEFQALDLFYSKLDRLNVSSTTLIRLRPHPSEDAAKYQNWVNQHPDLNIVIDSTSTLSHAISKAQMVVGCESYALVVALHAGKKVYTALPLNAHNLRLPYKGIIELRHL